MKKHAQPYNPSDFAGYGQGGLAGYGQGGYDVGLENVGLIPGMDPRLSEQSRSQGLGSPWAVPIGLAASGLVGYSLLKGMGRRLAGRAAQQAVPRAASGLTPEVEQIVNKWAPKQASILEKLGTIAR